jgi:DNA-binding MarR family transcriptional regulator
MGHYSVCYYSGMRSFSIDAYVVDTLMRDLIEHDGRPSSFVVYLYLWGRTIGQSQRSVHQSHQQLADATGLSKSAVQGAIRTLTKRQLVTAKRRSPTARPEYTVHRPWMDR